MVLRNILPSSASNYGKINKDLIATEDFPLNPLTNYSKANALAEENILTKSKNFCVTVLRQGTVYGYSPKMRSDLVINRMTYEAWRNNRILLLKDGTQRRPVLHIEDAINAMNFILKQDDKAVNGEIFNVGTNGNNVSVIELSETLKKILQKKLKLNGMDQKIKEVILCHLKKLKS